MEMQKKQSLDALDEIAQQLYDLSDAIWDHPETNFEEYFAAREQCALLEKLGFTVEKNIDGMPTAFSGTFGSGKPIIGFMGEYDALSGLSQVAGIGEKKAIEEGQPGHGCGHNLLGVGVIGAACATAKYLQETGKSGTVIYYGCPAEEGGSGKTFMARDGVFNHLDCALYWHPGGAFQVNHDSTLANFAVDYHFTGVSAHAAAAPHRGRSALDAVAMMNMGVQYLREHVLPTTRIHYAITDTGGDSPCIPARATVSYLIRAPKVSQVSEAYERVNNIARGAALMTDTQVEIEFCKACSDQRVNQNLNEVLQQNLEAIPLPELTGQDVDGMLAIRRGIDTLKPLPEGELPVPYKVKPLVREVGVVFASGDLGDVSYICPTGELNVATWFRGTSAHTWEAVAQGKSDWVHKCLLFAGKVLAGTAIDLLNDPEKLEKAKQEHLDTMPEGGYVCPIPAGVKPPNALY